MAIQPIVGCKVGPIAMVDEPRVVAAQDEASQPRIEIAVMQQHAAQVRGLRLDRVRIQVQIEPFAEAPYGAPGSDEFDGENAQAVDRAAVQPNRHQQHRYGRPRGMLAFIPAAC